MKKMSTVSFAAMTWLITPVVSANTEKVEQVFKANCASCHGEALQGAMAPPLTDKTWLTDGSDSALSNAIKLGIKGTSMPAFAEKLSDDTIRALVVFIREAGFKAAQQTQQTASASDTFTSKYHTIKTREIASADGVVWALDFLPDNSVLFTLRKGELWRLYPDGQKQKISGTPKVWHKRQGGLLDVKPDPDYAKNGWIYLSFSHPVGTNKDGEEIAITKIVRGKIENNQWQQEQTLFEAKPQNYKNRGWHFGSRFAIVGDYLFFSNGDEGHQDDAQLITTQNGKIHRIHKDGRIPTDNPFYGQAGAQQTIWSYGNRNPQGLTVQPSSGQLWATEHGPRGGDELNLIEKGTNYGWPKVTFGINYNGTPITEHTEMVGMKSPVHHWTPSIAVAGINFYQGNLFANWQGDLFAGSLAKQQLHRLRIVDNKVIEDEVILQGLGRIRDVVAAPSGELYVTFTDRATNTSKIVALAPAK